MEIHLNQQMHCVLTKEDIYHDQLWAPIAKQRCDYVWFAEHGGIERRIGLNISNEDEELHRVVELKKELMEKQKWVLILDGMNETFGIQKLGVPVQVKGCKLSLTNRSEQICLWMKFPIYFATTLSIDRGGVRCIIPSLVLAALEAKL